MLFFFSPPRMSLVARGFLQRDAGRLTQQRGASGRRLRQKGCAKHTAFHRFWRRTKERTITAPKMKGSFHTACVRREDTQDSRERGN